MSPNIQRSTICNPRAHTADRRGPCIYYTTTAVSFLRILQQKTRKLLERESRSALYQHRQLFTEFRRFSQKLPNCYYHHHGISIQMLCLPLCLLLALLFVVSGSLSKPSNYCAEIASRDTNGSMGYFSIQIFRGVASYSYNLDLSNLNKEVCDWSQGLVSFR